MKDFRKVEIALAVFVFSALLCVYEFVRLNDENVALKEQAQKVKYCRISFDNSIADMPCKITEIENVAEVTL